MQVYVIESNNPNACGVVFDRLHDRLKHNQKFVFAADTSKWRDSSINKNAGCITALVEKLSVIRDAFDDDKIVIMEGSIQADKSYYASNLSEKEMQVYEVCYDELMGQFSVEFIYIYIEVPGHTPKQPSTFAGSDFIFVNARDALPRIVHDAVDYIRDRENSPKMSMTRLHNAYIERNRVCVGPFWLAPTRVELDHDTPRIVSNYCDIHNDCPRSCTLRSTWLLRPYKGGVQPIVFSYFDGNERLLALDHVEKESPVDVIYGTPTKAYLFEGDVGFQQTDHVFTDESHVQRHFPESALLVITPNACVCDFKRKRDAKGTYRVSSFVVAIRTKDGLALML